MIKRITRKTAPALIVVTLFLGIVPFANHLHTVNIIGGVTVPLLPPGVGYVIANAAGPLEARSTAPPAPAPKEGKCSFYDPRTWPGCVLIGLTAIVGFVLKVVLIILGWILEIVIAVNRNIIKTPSVQLGFGLTLAVANLGFVLGIIVIAIATILRKETYGIKSILWKLVTAAIIVNFGLVIAGVILNFADQFTLYFSNAVTGAGGSISGFVADFSTAFAPQTAAGTDVAQNPFANISGATLMGQLVGFFASIAITLVAIISLLAFVVMLLIRYVYLAILLIIMPLAWLMWIFPKFSHHLTNWWNKFLQWAFFAPIAMFFIYLALYVWQKRADYLSGTVASLKVNPDSASRALSGLDFLQNFFSNFITLVAEQVVIIALMLGGLFAANKMSITGAGVAMGYAKSVGNAAKGYVGGYAGRRGKQIATAPLRGRALRERAARWQQPDRNIVTRWAGRLMEAGGVAGGAKSVEAAKDRIKGDTDQQNLNKLSTSEGPYTRMARLSRALDNKTIGQLSIEEQEKYFGKDKKGEFERYHNEKTYKRLREESGAELRDLQGEEQKLSARDTSGISAEERVEHERKLEENRQKQKVLKAKQIEENADDLAGSFTDPERLQTKREEAQKKSGRIPASLDAETITRMQTTMIKDIANGVLSPHNISALVGALSKQNNLDGFEGAVRRMMMTDKEGFKKLQDALRGNERVLGWNDKNIARGTLDIDLRKVYGIGSAEKGGGRVTIAEGEGGGGVRETIHFDKEGN